MREMTPLLHWLMAYLLERRCNGSKNQMAQLLEVDHQTLRLAFRRTEQEKAGLTPRLAERIMCYFFTHREELDEAIQMYSHQAELRNVCPQAKDGGQYLLARMRGKKNAPQYMETVELLENLRRLLGCLQMSVGENARYCQMHGNCPLQQLVVIYNHYLAEIPERGESHAG